MQATVTTHSHAGPISECARAVPVNTAALRERDTSPKQNWRESINNRAKLRQSGIEPKKKKGSEHIFLQIHEASFAICRQSLRKKDNLMPPSKNMRNEKEKILLKTMLVSSCSQVVRGPSTTCARRPPACRWCPAGVWRPPEMGAGAAGSSARAPRAARPRRLSSGTC